MERHGELTNFIWSVADLLRGDYKQSEYGRVILPLTVLRRLDCVLEPTKAKVLAEYEAYRDKIDNIGPILANAAGQSFYNTSKYDFTKLLAETGNLADATISYVNGFSDNARVVLEKFDFPRHVQRLDQSNLLFVVLKRFETIDLHPSTVDNTQMGYIYEELIRRFSEQSNETAGEHFTPREVIEMMVNLLFAEDDDLLRKEGALKSMYDPACGTGGMLTVAERHLASLNPKARLDLFGQELNPETYATCVSDMMLKGNNPDNIVFGNTFTEDGLAGRQFDYMLCNPPFGVDWKKYSKPIEDEARQAGLRGPLRCRHPQGVGRVAAVPAAHDLEDETGASGRVAVGDRVQRLAAVHRGGRVGGVGDPPVDHRERLAGGDRRPSRPAVLQHGHLHLRVGAVEPQTPRTPGQGAADRRPPVLPEDAQEPGRQTKRARPRRHRQHHPALRRLRRDQTVEDLPQRAFRLPPDRGGTPPPLPLPHHRRRHRTGQSEQVLRSAGRTTQEAPRTRRRRSKPGSGNQQAVLAALDAIRAFETTDPKDFEKHLKKALKAEGADVPAQLVKAIVAAAAERDEDAPAETDSKGNPVPDSDLRDNENVPLVEDIDEYVGAGGAALRARRLDRPRQDQGRVRDPVHPGVLRVRAAQAARGDRRGDRGLWRARFSSCFGGRGRDRAGASR